MPPESPSPWEQGSLLDPAQESEPARPVAEAAKTGSDPAARTEQRPAPVSLPSLIAKPLSGEPSVPDRLLILDTETTGLSPDDSTCIEVGAILFHVPSRSVLMQLSFLLPCDSNPAEAVNGIPAEVTGLEQPLGPALSCFAAMAKDADAVLAHNTAFDRQWFGRGQLPAIDKPWICSMEDIRWPPERRLRGRPSVQDLALAHGIPVWAAHRALTDCTYLAQVLERCGDLEGLLRLALEPRRLYRARVSYDERHRAREAGFRWNDPIEKAWTRRLSQREAEALPFRVVPVDDAPSHDSRAHAPLPRTA